MRGQHYKSILQVHTLPDPTPIATVIPRTDEHDGRYSDGIQSIFSLACMIHVSSELRLVPRYRGGTGSAAVVRPNILGTSMTIVPLLVKRQESVEPKERTLEILPVLKMCRHAPLLSSHSLTVLSLDADASLVESCEKATELTELLWPSSVCRHAPQLLLISGLTVIPSGSSCRNNFLITLSVGLNSSADAYAWRG
jgi:hypothetical protein